MMKRSIIFIVLGAALLSGTLAYPENNFKPWGSDIKVGDETKKIIKLKRETGGRSGKRGPVESRVTPVYNGVQGGAFFLIRFFQLAISPQDGANCRFIPTCSAYGKHSVEKHGAFLGAVLAGERLIRCNPYNVPGYDPVPDKILKSK